jgi:hypothetical protein
MAEVSSQGSGQPEKEMINQLEKTVSPLTENLETEPMDRTFSHTNVSGCGILIWWLDQSRAACWWMERSVVDGEGDDDESKGEWSATG